MGACWRCVLIQWFWVRTTAVFGAHDAPKTAMFTSFGLRWGDAVSGKLSQACLVSATGGVTVYLGLSCV